MLFLYLLALLVGGGLLLISLLGGDDGSGPLGDGDNPVQFLSLRTLTYFLFVFGGVGALLSATWPRATAPLILLLATVSGAGTGALAAALFGYLRRTESGNRESDESFVGLAGTIVVPIAGAQVGKVRVQRGDRSFELLARPFDSDPERDPASWTTVVVIEMRRGVALVSPVDDSALQRADSLLQLPGEK